MCTEDLREYWDKKAPEFASRERRRRSGRFRELYEEGCWRYIELLLPPVETGLILETGCGTGRWVFRLAPMGYRVVLSDLSAEMIRHAGERVEQQGLGGRVAAYHVLDICDMHALADESVDMVLALGVPLSLCSDPERAIEECRRVTRPGGHVVCDMSNRYRTALDLARENRLGPLADLLDTGRITRETGLTQHHFSTASLHGLFRKQGMEILHLAALCPFFEFPATKEHVEILNDEETYRSVQDLFRRYAEDPNVIALSSRLLVAARKKTPG